MRETNSCAPTPCVYPDRCLAEGRGCVPGAGGNACDRCLTAADVANQGPLTTLNKAGYYKAGATCAVCPATSAVQIFAAAAVVVVFAFFGFKASQVMGAQATNNLKKIVESLQFFSLSLGMSIEWPGPVLNLGKYLEAFTFSIEFLRPECVATGLNWFNIFVASVFVVPLSVLFIIVYSDVRSRRRYDATVRAIHSETQVNETGVEAIGKTTTVYWIERRGYLWGTRRTFESEGGDKIVKELQRQYRFRASLRSFGVLAMTVLYLPIIRMCIQSYDCITLSGVDGKRLEHDIDIDCDSPQHQATQSVASFMLFFVGVGMPLYVVRQVRKIRIQGKLDDPRTLDAYGAFYDIYRRDELSRADKLEIARVTRAERHETRGIGIDEDEFIETRRVAKEAEKEVNDERESNNVRVQKGERQVDVETDPERADNLSGSEVTSLPPPIKLLRSLSSFLRSQSITRPSSVDDKERSASDVAPRSVSKSPSAKARARAVKMRWRDQFALYYLAIELAQKSSVILATSAVVAESPTSGWLLVFVHWFIGGFVWACQPWRVMTLGFGKWRVPNALNKVEALGAILQGLAPCLAMAFPVERDEDGNVRENLTFDVITALLTAFITGLLAIRVLVFTAERLAVRRKKMDMESDPESSIKKVHAEMLELAKSGAVVSLYAFKADFDIKRRKTRARLEDTRHAMLIRIEHLKTHAESADEVDRAELAERIIALYEVANEMAHVVNTILPKPMLDGAEVYARAADVELYLERALEEENARYARDTRDDGSSNTALAEHIALLVHSYDRAVARLDEHMMAYAEAESLPNLIVLAQTYRELCARQRAVAIGFGNEETQAALERAFDSKDVVATLRLARKSDDIERLASAIVTSNTILVEHVNWCRAQAKFFTRLVEANQALLSDLQHAKATSSQVSERNPVRALARRMMVAVRRKRTNDGVGGKEPTTWPSIIPLEPPLTTQGVCDVALAALVENESRIDMLARQRASTWASIFNNVGRARFARAIAEQIRQQLPVDVSAVMVEDTEHLFEDALTVSSDVTSWCDASTATLSCLKNSDMSIMARFGVAIDAATASLASVRVDAVAHGTRATHARDAVHQYLKVKDAARGARDQRVREYEDWKEVVEAELAERLEEREEAREKRAREVSEYLARHADALEALERHAAEMEDYLRRELVDAEGALEAAAEAKKEAENESEATEAIRRASARVTAANTALNSELSANERARDAVNRRLSDKQREVEKLDFRARAEATKDREHTKKKIQLAKRAIDKPNEQVAVRRAETVAIKAVRLQRIAAEYVSKWTPEETDDDSGSVDHSANNAVSQRSESDPLPETGDPHFILDSPEETEDLQDDVYDMTEAIDELQGDAHDVTEAIDELQDDAHDVPEETAERRNDNWDVSSSSSSHGSAPTTQDVGVLMRGVSDVVNQL